MIHMQVHPHSCIIMVSLSAANARFFSSSLKVTKKVKVDCMKRDYGTNSSHAPMPPRKSHTRGSV